MKITFNPDAEIVKSIDAFVGSFRKVYRCYQSAISRETLDLVHDGLAMIIHLIIIGVHIRPSGVVCISVE